MSLRKEDPESLPDQQFDCALLSLLSEPTPPTTPGDMHVRVRARLRKRFAKRIVRRVSAGFAIAMFAMLLVKSLPTQPLSRELASLDFTQPASNIALTDDELAQIFALPPVDMMYDLNRAADRALRFLDNGGKAQ